MSYKKILLIVISLVLIINAFLGIIVVLFGELDGIGGDVLLTTLSVGYYTIVGLCAGALIDRKVYKYFAYTVFCIAGVGLLFALIAIWSNVSIEFNWFSKTLISFINISLALGYISLLLIIRCKKDIVKILQYITIFFVTICALIIETAIWDLIGDDYDDFVAKTFLILLILTILLTLLIPILNKFLDSDEKSSNEINPQHFQVRELEKGIYEHYKGKRYELLGEAIDSETLQEMVIYKAQYNSEEFGENATWVRPKKMFFEEIEVEGVKIPRFKKIK